MNLGQLFRGEVFTGAADYSLRKITQIMQDNEVGAVVIVKGQKVVGIVTDRDVALAVGLGAAGPDTPVSQVMTKQVDTVWEDEGIFNATQHMRGRKVRRLPIINHDNELVGIVTLDDLISLLANELHNVSKAVSDDVLQNAAEYEGRS